MRCLTGREQIEEAGILVPVRERKWERNKKWKEICDSGSGTFGLIDVIEHGLQLSTRKRHRKSIDRKYVTRNPQAVVETFEI